MPELAGKRLLLCEDNALNTEIACELLKSCGAAVDTAADGRIGLELFQRQAPGTYAAILMDMRMPVMNGVDATRAIRALNRPDSKTVPIIAMTANAFEEDVQAALDNGMNDHIAKPISLHVVMETLAKYIHAE
jgi:two-component system sensor histidine kinase/response regulator